jgi:hypothetical protein
VVAIEQESNLGSLAGSRALDRHHLAEIGDDRRLPPAGLVQATIDDWRSDCRMQLDEGTPILSALARCGSRGWQ